MAEITVFYDKVGQTLTVWFADRSREVISEETGHEIVLMKDRSGNVIGLEKLNFVAPDQENLRVTFETVSL
ncbi:MAG: DUF2283 domain-containing protein [Rhodothermales bacterium]